MDVDKNASGRPPHPPPPRAKAGTGSHRPLAKESRDAYFRNLYTKAPDFKAIALVDPDFAAVFNSVKGRELDFNDPKSVANRHNYILWLKDLLDTTSYDEPGGKAVGLDIGTGASCIYPLLGCVQRPWSFIATDIDDKSLEWARKNIKLNGLESRIQVIGRKLDDALIPLDDIKLDSLDFTMTNPPFYESEEAMVKSAEEKSRPPFTACTGAKVEMVTPGGEVGFVDRIFQESLVLRERVRWYTAMVGFLSSLTRIVDRLREHKIDNYALTEFQQGNKTRRWAIGWSFRPLRPAQSVARGTKAALSKGMILPAITEYVAFQMPLCENIGGFAETLSSAIAALDLMSWEWDREKLQGVGRAVDKVWARAWRRRKKREAEAGEQGKGEEKATSEQMCTFGFRVAVRVSREHVSVEARWLEGHDETAFESFRGFLKAASEKATEDVKKKVDN
ncbi:hypothetical protein BBK36DRAFT_1115822 [Trichoderma citrinoviride]|uniref:U6 small nuclear RNA (adenine-(43)-N(6))-methyltransferase n=1 Tax=Trichoderma citrinoviride TaxID=58853 RepID=A0A2T4BE61_9HYPO|nr:hypothetical protein BBK36DRAFT_1115822 [Trichoderma citrinoviride]PTB67620.1 hypothetical protein BBK36DRAFT_1115822 [Trichoderma citrinoviride]